MRLNIILNAADAQREATSNTFNQEKNLKVEVKDHHILADQEIVNMVKNISILSLDTKFTMNEPNSYYNNF